MEAVEVERVLNLVPALLDVPHSRIWTVYDKEADVLYLNFKKPSHADDSELTDDDLIIRYEKGSVVGTTVLNASRRGADVVCDGGYVDLETTGFGTKFMYIPSSVAPQHPSPPDTPLF